MVDPLSATAQSNYYARTVLQLVGSLSVAVILASLVVAGCMFYCVSRGQDHSRMERLGLKLKRERELYDDTRTPSEKIGDFLRNAIDFLRPRTESDDEETISSAQPRRRPRPMSEEIAPDHVRKCVRFVEDITTDRNTNSTIANSAPGVVATTVQDRQNSHGDQRTTTTLESIPMTAVERQNEVSELRKVRRPSHARQKRRRAVQEQTNEEIATCCH